MSFELPKLPYAYDALEPYIDARTMEIHHTKHHAAYTSNLNKAIEGTEREKLSIEQLLKEAVDTPAIRNNAGGFYNHNLFWKVLAAPHQSKPSENLLKAINQNFSSFEAFKKEFEGAAATRFGSGWAWLCVCPKEKKLFVSSSANQDNPLMPFAERSGTPILGLDVWEHAYYLKYQNRRPEYIAAFWEVANWEEVSKSYEKTLH